MSIKISICAGLLKTEATLKDSAYGELMQFVFNNQDGTESVSATSKLTPKTPDQGQSPKVDQNIDRTKDWLKQHTSSEVLTRLSDWITHPQKIALVAACYESNGGAEGWKSADIEAEYSKAKEKFTANFPRDIRTAIDEGLVGSVTARSYKVSRIGWNRIADSIAKAETPPPAN